jgi:hypothetical protein
LNGDGVCTIIALSWCLLALEVDAPMDMTLIIGPVVALIAGILILIVPRLLNYVVAIYLIIIGLLGLLHGPGGFHVR